jgi:hypothetical protein
MPYSRTSQRVRCFCHQLTPAVRGLVYSTFLGGSEEENYRLISDTTPVGSIFVDALGIAYLTGKTASTNFLSCARYNRAAR